MNLVPGAQSILNIDDYAGTPPRPKRKRPEVQVAKGMRTFDMQRPDDQVLYSQSLTQRYSYGPLAGTRIKVIGQPDLTADWKPSQHEKAKPAEGLISRGPEWPFASEAERTAA
jgi:hypothetical protein